MKKLVIIGNRFDVAHGLPTKYSDFINYLKSHEKEPEHITDNWILANSVTPHDQEKHSFYEAICKYIPEDDLWNYFEYALCILDSEEVQDENSNYLMGYGDDNWRDSAHHDYQYMIEQDLSFAYDIPKYFHEWIIKINTDVSRIIPTKIINPDCLFLNFNYTDILEKTYDIPTERILYIHGNALRGDKLILGHHDKTLFQDPPLPVFETEEEREMYYDSLDDDVRIIEAKEIIRSYFKTTYKDTALIIRHNYSFFESLTSIDEIYILGHSLSVIDFDYFNEIIRFTLSTCKWYISYYSEDDYFNVQKFVNKLRLQNYQLITFADIK